jgi:hypothetical protein
MATAVPCVLPQVRPSVGDILHYHTLSCSVEVHVGRVYNFSVHAMVDFTLVGTIVRTERTEKYHACSNLHELKANHGNIVIALVFANERGTSLCNLAVTHMNHIRVGLLNSILGLENSYLNSGLLWFSSVSPGKY